MKNEGTPALKRIDEYLSTIQLIQKPDTDILLSIWYIHIKIF